jgi:phosphatidate cytidylyltransferase
MKSANSVFNAQLLTRLISALALLPIVLGALWFGGWFFAMLLALASVLMAYEWLQMIKASPSQASFMVWALFGLVYIFIPLLAFYWLRQQADGVLIVFWVFIMVWAMDVGGFFAGKSIGGPKMAPKISPNKTWSGLTGGVLLAIVAHLVIFYILSLFSFEHEFLFQPTWLIAGAVAVVAQVGDLIESQCKRHFAIKDTSGLIPGHGGLLDRVDGLLLAGPVVVLLLCLGLV